MATIGSLSVNIVAVTDKFNKGLKAAQGMLSNFASSLGGVQSVVAGLAAGGLAMIAEQAIEAGGKIQELTAKLNISAEAITALHFAAEQLESSASAVDMAIGKMSLTLGKALAGSDPAIGAFNALGLSINAIATQRTEQQFLAVIDALHKMPPGAEQAAAAMAIFGKGYKDIVPLINAGTDAIVQQGQKAAELGVVLSGDQVAALDDAGDAVNRFSASWEGLKTQMVATFAPAIAAAFDVIVGGLKVLKTFWWGVQVLILDGCTAISRAIQFLENSFSWLPVVGDWLAKDAAAADGLVESFQNAAAEKVNNIQSLSGGGAGPLAKSTADLAGSMQTGAEAKAELKATAADKKQEEKETANNTKIIAEQMKLLNENAKLGRATSQADLDAVKVKIAGVR